MKRSIAIAGFLLTLLSWAQTYEAASLPSPERDQNDKGANRPGETHARFPDFGFLPPKDQYDGQLFHLRQNYPAGKPPDNLLPEFLRIPFDDNRNGQQNWKRYLLAVRDYCFEGNIDTDRGPIDRRSYNTDWNLYGNKKRDWFHAPWQHFGRNGREGIHGLTREATAQPKQLAADQNAPFDTYAVGFYNQFGAYTIGQVWHDHYHPSTKAVRFPVGTVVCKILFTQATADQVPYLVNPVEWQAFAEIQGDKTHTRKVQTLTLLQMDVMIRDSRAERINKTGWVFGTFCYNGTLGNPDRWYNLVPVGLQWGADPDIDDGEVNPRPTRTIINRRLKETVINPSPELPPQHLGWGGRLNGPADYFASSCVSCHSTSQYPVIAAMNPEFKKSSPEPRGSRGWMRWFRNLKCGDPFSDQAQSLDFSLQLANGLKNFDDWHREQGGQYARTTELPREHSKHSAEVKRGRSSV
jgi:hypothetical protein